MLGFFVLIFIIGCNPIENKTLNDKYHGLPSSLEGKWKLEVYNLLQKPLLDMNIRFTAKPAESCSSGDWSEVEVLAMESHAENGFQPDNKLSYNLVDNTIVIGRNQLCDAYLRLEGNMDAKQSIGLYYTLGHGGTKELGSYKLLLESN